MSAIICCVLILLGILLPLILISDLVVVQSLNLYRTAGPQIDELVQKGSSGALGKIMNSYAGQYLTNYGITIEIKPMLLKGLKYFGSVMPGLMHSFSRTTAGIAFDLFIIVFSLFYFLKDGEYILQKARDIIPISKDNKDKIISRFKSMSNATLKGILFVAFIQSFLATMILWIFGVQAWLLWGIVMLVLSTIPFVGTSAVLIPAGIIKIVTGDIFQGIAIIILSIFFISLIDNVLRPRIIGRRVGMHNLLVFFSIIGGIFSFGPAGLIIGPLIITVFQSVLEIYKVEFESQVNYSNK